jgi:hypothetical protein
MAFDPGTTVLCGWGVNVIAFGQPISSELPLGGPAVASDRFCNEETEQMLKYGFVQESVYRIPQ